MEKKDNKPAKAAKSAKIVAKPPAPVEVVKEEVTRERHNSGEAAKEQRKGAYNIHFYNIKTGFNFKLESFIFQDFAHMTQLSRYR